MAIEYQYALPKKFALQLLTLQKKLDQLPAVDIQHAPAKLPSKLHMFAYVDFFGTVTVQCAQ